MVRVGFGAFDGMNMNEEPGGITLRLIPASSLGVRPCFTEGGVILLLHRSRLPDFVPKQTPRVYRGPLTVRIGYYNYDKEPQIV